MPVSPMPKSSAPSPTAAEAALGVASLTKRTNSVRLVGKRSDYLKLLRALGRGYLHRRRLDQHGDS